MKFQTVISLLSCAMLASSCSVKVEVDHDGADQDKPSTEKPQISVSPSVLECEPEGGTYSLELKSNGAWLAESPDQLTISPASGEGNRKVSVSLSANPVREKREFSVNFVCKLNGEQAESVLRVTQKMKPGPYFKSEMPDELVLGFNASDQLFKAESDLSEQELKCTSDQQWCNVSIQAGQLVISVEEYAGDMAPRKAKIEVSANNEVLKTSTVVQEAHTSIHLSNEEVVVNPDGETLEVKVITNCYGWKVSTEDTWFTVKQKDASTLILTVRGRGENETEKRFGSFAIEANTGSCWASFTVADDDSNLSSEDIGYGDHTDWD